MQQLINSSEKYLQDTKQGRVLLGSMIQFESASRHHVCLFSGAKLLYFSRGFIVGTCTLALSLFFVAKEMLDSELRGNSDAGSHVINSIFQASVIAKNNSTL
ncbi:hypothetical protein BV898_02790 [Hypsibius exemplaris]|uniref:Uncharacterized protein n=1 Tax=Hypsibius exemplaris TaxID=2072580 RepID=A0A1W0X767_HYPEX|nr:hypothetical protein BV898_02790 [Hypsibius exemplaris]